jgi:hypothetical protein
MIPGREGKDRGSSRGRAGCGEVYEHPKSEGGVYPTFQNVFFPHGDPLKM